MTQYQAIILIFGIIYIGGCAITMSVMSRFANEYISEGKCPDLPFYRAILIGTCAVVSLVWPAWWIFVFTHKHPSEGN